MNVGERPMLQSIGDIIDASRAAWSFGGAVPENFKEHVRRSVPGYDAGHEMILHISDFLVHDDSVCYEIGSSTERADRCAGRTSRRPVHLNWPEHRAIYGRCTIQRFEQEWRPADFLRRRELGCALTCALASTMISSEATISRQPRSWPSQTAYARCLNHSLRQPTSRCLGAPALSTS